MFRSTLYLTVGFVILIGVASSYDFGSKVDNTSPDLGYPLVDFGGSQVPIDIGYWDVGPNPQIFDEDDMVYLHFGSAVPTTINANDIRLTTRSDLGLNAGSKVRASDIDCGKPLLPLPAPPLTAGIYFMDLYGSSPGYDVNDLIYLKTLLPAGITATNDVRLSNAVHYNGTVLSAGTKVLDFHADHNRLIIPMIIGFPIYPPVWQESIATIRFYNANGNTMNGVPIYDYNDEVYIDVPFSPLSPGVVSVNDVHLTV
ncbi:MAG: hypothetical protein H5T42_04515 [Methanothrix sp.]|jgi:hypothetical protein|uniref:Uncharacterized protein n=1 Tax=Methanothrix thermoacetophila (strain DSM 6194 / JCM 14653 / NBRC 101360 / PT) TaxID=349307 RepID=A0B659_METTP|nr:MULTISPECIES: hypothetical protein [Methanothrix]ABK14183.1 hypothetical protein Mthe_0390 [Methanothrix thermoacetophila PT]MBC7079718.1 hypothetical protein [Methanothrix sp.]NPU87793.1 hypothetical protein [Methanothrix sp.]